MKKIIGVVVAIFILMVASVISQLTKAMLNVIEFGEKLYPSLGKLAFFLEAIVSLSPLIIGIWLIKLSWRKITYEEPIVESTENKEASSSFTKAVYNHAKDIAAEAKPAISEYKQKHATSQTQAENQHIDLVDEDAIYEQVMLEIEEDRKVKSTWAKALAQSDGDREKTEALYIKLRVQNIIEARQEERLKNSEAEIIKTESTSINTVEKGEQSGSNILVTLSPFIAGGIVLIFIILNIINENKQLQGGKETQSSVAPQIQQKNNSTHSEVREIGYLYPLDTITVNLKSDAGRRYLKVTMSLELEGKKLSIELDKKIPVIRDRIIRIFTSKTLEEISTRQGKEEISNQIINTLNAMLTSGNINGLYFTEFVIQ